MTKYTRLIAFFVAIIGMNGALYAQIKIKGTVPAEVIPNAATGLEQIFLVNGLQGVSLTFSDTDPHQVTWKYYEKSLSDAVVIKQEAGVTSSSIEALQTDRGYLLDVDGRQSGIWLIDYAQHATALHGLTVDDSGEDRCSMIKLLLDVDAPELFYYSINGSRQTLMREYTLIYDQLVWDEKEKSYTKISQSRPLSGSRTEFFVDAPYCNTTYQLVGDQFASFFGLPDRVESDLYLAKAVIAHPETIVDERDVPNETEDAVELGGSGPVTVRFESHANEEVASFYEWELSKDPEFTNLLLRFTDPSLTHTFEESGTTYVRLIVSNEYCVDSVNVFDVNVNDSFIEAPNFFTPGTTPGVNDEFRVAYKSIVSFHGWIYNRWGVKMFEWKDPAKGWDGKHNGKIVAPGVYFYVIQASGADGKKYKLKGDINILGTK